MLDFDIPGYRVHKLLGKGGMATVYLATQLRLNREVALKVIAPNFAVDQEFRERFVAEGQLTARLSHRNIMTVFDIGEANGTFFLATEVLPGGTLNERLPQLPNLTSKLLVVRDIAEGLGVAHQQRIVHRDIKPANIMFRADGTPVVTDFGIAKSLDVTRALTVQGMIVGTPTYMSPEQAQGQPLDGRSDIYSLGIMLYEMLTGELPFVGTDPFSIAFAHITRPPPPLPTKLAAIQPLLDKMLEKLPDNRIHSAAAVCEAIDALLPTLDEPESMPAGESARLRVRPRPVTETQPLSAQSAPAAAAPARRRLALIGGAGLAGALLLGLAIWQWPEGQAVSAPELGTTDAGLSDWDALLQDARQRISQRFYFAPVGGSAYDTLQLLLQERPTDRDAIELIDLLCRSVADDIERLRKADDRMAAARLLNEALQRFPNNTRLRELQAGASEDGALSANASDSEVEQWRSQAALALSDGRISQPPGDNALELYRRILLARPDDQDAQQRLRAMAADYAKVADTWLQRGRPDLAYTQAMLGLQAVANDAELLRIRDAARQSNGGAAP
nr:serine/threonine-protein kinase [Pseudomarimonas arenosa]